MDELNHLGWVVYKSYEFAAHHLGIRTNSEKAGEWLAETLGAYEVDEEADPYYSLYMGEGDGVGRRYHILYREGTDLMRALDPAAVARRLVAELDALALKTRGDRLYLDGGIVRKNGVAALVPSAVIPYIRMNGRKVERELALPTTPALAIDDAGRLRLVPRQLEVDEGAFDDLRRRLGANGRIAAPDDIPESVGLICAFHYDPGAPPIIPLTRALTVYHLAHSVINLPAVGGRALGVLVELVGDARCYLLQEARADEAYELLKSVLEGKPVLEEPAATG